MMIFPVLHTLPVILSRGKFPTVILSYIPSTDKCLRQGLEQWFLTRFPPVQSGGSARSYTNSHLILLIKLNSVFFCTRQLNYCTEVSRATEMFSWGSAPLVLLQG